MKLFKLTAAMTALMLALFVGGCELDDEEGSDTVNGTSDVVDDDTGNGVVDPCPTCPSVEEGSFSLVKDDACDESLFFDADCADSAKGDLSIRCGKTSVGCSFTEGICESFQPCGAVWKLTVGDISYLVAKPCPNDPDCGATADEPPFACEDDGHCDTWCPVDPANPTVSIDPDCAGTPINEAAAYCAGGDNVDQCN